MAPPLCVAAPAHATIALSPSTTLSFDPMDLDTAAFASVPQGKKRGLAQVYSTMGEKPRKLTKTRELITSRAHIKHGFRNVADWHFSTPESASWASAACKKMAVKSLFFRFKPNSTCFDFTLDGIVQGAVSFVKSPVHDTAMYLFEGNLDRPFASEFLSFTHQTSLPHSVAPPLATLAPAPAVIPGPAPAQAIVPAAANQSTSMDTDELPLSHPSRMGNNSLPRREHYQLESKDLLHSLVNLARDDREMKAKAAEELRWKQLQFSLAGRDLSEQQQQQPVRRLCPFDEDEDEDQEDEDERMEEDPPTSTTPPGSPLRPSDDDQGSDDSATSEEESSSAQDPSIQQAPAPAPSQPVAPPTLTAVVDSASAPVFTPSALVSTPSPPVSTPSPPISTVSNVSQTTTRDVVDQLPLSRLRLGKDHTKDLRSREKTVVKLEKRSRISKPAKTAAKIATKTAAKVANNIKCASHQQLTTADKFREFIQKGRVEKSKPAIGCSLIEEKEEGSQLEDSSPWADEPGLVAFANEDSTSTPPSSDASDSTSAEEEDDSEDLSHISNDDLFAVDDSPTTSNDQSPSSPSQKSVPTPGPSASVTGDNTTSGSPAVTVTTTAPMSASAPVSTVVPTAAPSAAAANISRLVGTREYHDSLNCLVDYEYNMAEMKRL